MLARYQIVRGARPADNPLPAGIRQDTRKHTQHVLRPSAEIVQRFLRRPDEEGFSEFRDAYLSLLSQRFARERGRFDELAELARGNDVYIGCNCPTRAQPHVEWCHTALALGFMAQRYPDLEVRAPGGSLKARKRGR